MVLVS
jgi:hypothetical protein